MIVDAHTHTFSPAAANLAADALAAAGTDAVPYLRDMSAESRAWDDEQKAELGDKFNRIERRLDDMKAMGVTHQIVAPAPGQQHYWAPQPLLSKLSGVQNDHVLALVAAVPDRLTGIGTLPMTDPAAAVAEAERAHGAGLSAFQIDARVLERELSDRAFDPVYAALAHLGAGLVIHPLGFSHGARLSPYFMVNTVAQPLEELIAFHHLVFGGVLDRHPALKVLIVHGGGFAPFYIGRFDHAWRVRPEVRALIPEPPSAYLARLYYDTCVFRPDHLETLVRLVGAERAMLGSDYPFDMGDTDPVSLVRRADLTAAERTRICEGTAAEFFAS